MLRAIRNIREFIDFIDTSSVILNTNELENLKSQHVNRLYSGLTAQGDRIGSYAPSTIAYKKRKRQKWEYVTLSDTFTHYNTLFYEVKNSQLILNYVVSYAKYFVARYKKDRVMRLSRSEKLFVIQKTLQNYFRK